MRPITSFLLVILVLGCTTTRNTSIKAGKLDGTWVPIRQELGGTTIPNAAFEKNRLTLSDTTYTFIAESVDKGVVRYTNDKMDIYGREGVSAGKHYTALYKFENQELTICYNLAGDSYPESFDTKGKPMYFLSVFKKEEVK